MRDDGSTGASASAGAAAASGKSPEHALAMGMSAALGLTAVGLEHSLLAAAAPPPPPPPAGQPEAAGVDGSAQPAGVGCGGANGGVVGVSVAGAPTAAQIQESFESFKLMAAAAAAQSGGLVPDPFTLALMPSLLASGADPFLNLQGAAGEVPHCGLRVSGCRLWVAHGRCCCLLPLPLDVSRHLCSPPLPSRPVPSSPALPPLFLDSAKVPHVETPRHM
jgi:hypothetical protein